MSTPAIFHQPHTFILPTGGHLHYATAGDPQQPALLLLHGFPQTHVLWRRVAQQLGARYFLVMPDLRGYGDSFRPADEAEQAQMSKRAMAQDVVQLMQSLGHERFFLCGHDRGGRVSHRLALDHPQRVRKLAVLDIAPTLDMYGRTDMDFARAYYHWFHLIQPAPLPERMIAGDALPYLHTKLGGWGGAGLSIFEPQALADYERCFTPATIHTMCEDYRASAGIDLAHDRHSRERGEKVACDMLVLWGERGVVQRMFQPLALWQAQCAGTVSGQTLPCGHYMPEECPTEVAQLLGQFMVG
jgi:haloacetate dehalogenase